ncbi:hypothetical protein O1611_g7350 [Lasiodiplodia mahajangana]|uniref:Uncharacterized protein n=1 Tax=Lasiodiplodia mahajangana TaxID=1108764 RepID=A0ACC2JFJ3_9PEZI|nr:hypothetical protein O1611_g7350 [Lasiodiplodia mahajangana]
MFSQPSTLLASVCLLAVCHAGVILRSEHVGLSSANATLLSRVHLPNPVVPAQPKTTDLFLLGDDASADWSCSSKESTFDSWLEEVAKLHTAAATAFGTWQTDGGSRLLLTAWLGIQFDKSTGTVDSSSTAAFSAVQGRLAGISQFLNGGGVANPLTNQPPWLLCGDSWGTLAPWDQPVKDHDGDYIPVGQDFLTVAQAFPMPFAASARGLQTYWVDLLDAYLWDSRQLCQNDQRYAATSKRPYTSPNPQVKATGFDRFPFFCDRAFSPTTQTPPTFLHSAPSLANSVSSGRYPVQPFAPEGLDQWVPLSGTLYHELVHITDSAQTSGDPYYGLVAASRASVNKQPEIRLRVTNNAESYVLFAMAAYMYQNPPGGTPAVLWLNGGYPGIATDAIAKFA